MKRAISTLLLILAFNAQIADAVACRINVPIDLRIKSLRASDRLVGVVLARITEAKPIPHRIGMGSGWSAKAELIKTLSGNGNLTEAQIGRTGSSAACDDGIPIPQIGEVWVLYLEATDNKIDATLTYPIGIAKQIDPALESILHKEF